MRLLFAPLLGLRLLRGQGRTGILRIALMVLGTALGVGLLLIALSVQPVLHARDARLAARTPVCDKGTTCGLGEEVDGAYYGHAYLEELVDSPAGTPAPAGLSRLPLPGEVYLSPALRRLATTKGNELLRQRFGGTIVGTIGSSGLLQPDELIAYVGVATLSEQNHQGRIVGYGGKVGQSLGAAASAALANAQDDRNLQGRLDPRRVTVDMATVLLLLPVLIFLATCARLSARTRDRRLAALRLVGMTPWQTRVVNAVETGVAALAGSLAGLGFFELLRAPLSSVTLDGRGWFAADATPSASHILELMALIPALAVVVGTLAVGRLTGALTGSRTHAGPRRLRLWRLLPLTVGPAMLASIAATRPQGGSAVSLLGGGIILTLVGLAAGIPLLAQLVAAGIARVTGSLSVLLGARRLELETAATTRVVSGLVLLVFAGGFASATLSAVKADVIANADQFEPSLRSSVMTVESKTPSGTFIPLSTWSQIQGVTGALSLQTLIGKPVKDGDAIDAEGPSAVVASCADLTALLAAPPVGCRDGVPYRLPAGANGQDLPTTAPLHLIDQSAMDAFDTIGQSQQAIRTLTIAQPTNVLQIPNPDSFSNTLQATLVLPPGTPGLPPARPDHYFLLTDGSQHTVEAVRTAAARISPTLLASTAAEISGATTDVESYHFPLYSVLIGWGSAVALSVAFASVAVATVDRAVERRRVVAMQTAIGVPASTVRRAQLVQVLVPYGVGIVCATGFSVLAGLSYGRLVNPKAVVGLPAHQIMVTMLVALGGAFVVAISVLPSLGRPLTADLLRQE